MKRYCLSCGSPTEYSLKKPIFCSSCGKSFEESQVVVKKTLPQQKTIAKKFSKQIDPIDIDNDNDIDLDLDGDDVLQVPELNQLEVEIEKDRSNKGVKLGEIMGTGKSEERKERVKSKGKKTSKKEILENFQKEAGALRPSRRK